MIHYLIPSWLDPLAQRSRVGRIILRKLHGAVLETGKPATSGSARRWSTACCSGDGRRQPGEFRPVHFIQRGKQRPLLPPCILRKIWFSISLCVSCVSHDYCTTLGVRRPPIQQKGFRVLQARFTHVFPSVNTVDGGIGWINRCRRLRIDHKNPSLLAVAAMDFPNSCHWFWLSLHQDLAVAELDSLFTTYISAGY